MSWTLKYPRKKFDAERPIPVAQTRFLGQIKDAPGTELKAGYSAKLVNLVSRGAWEEGRAGSDYYASVDPVLNPTLYGAGFHEKSGRILTVYQNADIYDSPVDLGSYTFVPPLSALGPVGETKIVAYGRHAYAFAGNGIFRIVLDDEGVYFYQINTELPSVIITSVAETVTKVYGYKYTYSAARMRGNLQGNRKTSGVVLEWESGTCDDSSGTDFGLVYHEEEINPDQTNLHLVGLMTSPYAALHVTHFPLYRSFNVGRNSDPPGIDPVTGKGNQSELLVWVDDVPVTNCWYGSFDRASGVFTISVGSSNKADIGSSVFDENGIVIGTVASVGAGTMTITPAASVTGVGYSAQGIVYDLDNNYIEWDIGCIPFAYKGAKCTVSSTGTLPAISGGGNLVAGTEYYIIGAGLTHSSNAVIKLAETYDLAVAGTAIDLADAGTGTMTITTKLNQSFGIGNGRLITAHQSGTKVVYDSGLWSNWTDRPINKPMFWADGDWSLNLESGGGSDSQQSWSDTHAKQALMIVPASLQWERYYNDDTPDVGTDYGIEGLFERSERGDRLYFPMRLFDPLPAGSCGVIGDGFMVCADRDGVDYAYSQYANKPYCMGYYRPVTQAGEAPSSIRSLIMIGSSVVFLLAKKTRGLALNISSNVGRTDLGEDVWQLNQLTNISDDIGVYHWESVQKVNGPSVFVAITDETEPKVRMFLGDRWDDENLCYSGELPAVVEDIKWIASCDRVVSSYVPGPYGGYKVWGIRNGGSTSLDETYRCLRHAMTVSEGYGWSDISGEDWIIPASNGGVLVVRDAANNDRCIIRDDVDRNVYEDGTYDPSGDLTHPPFVDKQGVSDSDIPTQGWSPEISAEPNQNYKMLTEEIHDFVRPQDSATRGAAGYTDSGLRDTQLVTIEEYVDGEKNTANAVAYDVPEEGDISFAGSDVECRRIQYVRKTAASEFRRVAFTADILVRPDRGSRSEREMSENEMETILCDDLVYHLGRNATLGYERIGRQLMDWTGLTLSAGPDGNADTGLQFILGAPADRMIKNPAIGTAATVLFWRKGAPVLKAPGGATVAVTVYGDAFAGWSLCYATLASMATGYYFTFPTGTTAVNSVRIISGAVTQALLADYYRDVTKHEGRKYEPRY